MKKLILAFLLMAGTAQAQNISCSTNHAGGACPGMVEMAAFSLDTMPVLKARAYNTQIKTDSNGWIRKATLIIRGQSITFDLNDKLPTEEEIAVVYEFLQMLKSITTKQQQ